MAESIVRNLLIRRAATARDYHSVDVHLRKLHLVPQAVSRLTPRVRDADAAVPVYAWYARILTRCGLATAMHTLGCEFVQLHARDAAWLASALQMLPPVDPATLQIPPVDPVIKHWHPRPEWAMPEARGDGEAAAREVARRAVQLEALHQLEEPSHHLHLSSLSTTDAFVGIASYGLSVSDRTGLLPALQALLRSHAEAAHDQALLDALGPALDSAGSTHEVADETIDIEDQLWQRK